MSFFNVSTAGWLGVAAFASYSLSLFPGVTDSIPLSLALSLPAVAGV